MYLELEIGKTKALEKTIIQEREVQNELRSELSKKLQGSLFNIPIHT